MEKVVTGNNQKQASTAMTVIKWIDNHFEETLLIVLLALMACVELLQVVARNVSFVQSLTWAEEFCRFTWIATVFISLPYTIRTATTLRVTALAELLPWKAQNVLNILIDVINVIILAVLTFYSVEVLQRIISSGENSPAMLMPMWIMYLIVLLGFALGVIRGIQMCVLHIKSINVPPKNSIEAQVEEELGDDLKNPNDAITDGDQDIIADIDMKAATQKKPRDVLNVAWTESSRITPSDESAVNTHADENLPSDEDVHKEGGRA